MKPSPAPLSVGHETDSHQSRCSPVVRLNRAVAVGEAESPQAGLALLVGPDHLLADNHRLPSVRADLAQRAGDTDLAKASYRKAIELCHNNIERDYMRTKLAYIEASTVSDMR